MGSNNLRQYFKYGASADGYWTYDHMVLQLEDCVDIPKALHPGFYFIFLFDDSCGHDRGRKYGLDVTKTNSGYVGAQQDMHPTNIKQDFGCLGTHELILKEGDHHHMILNRAAMDHS